MSRRPSPATGKPYGLAAVARVWRVARATLYRHRRPLEASRPKHRPGPRGGYTDEQLLTAIRRALADSPFHGEGYRKVWARLRLAGSRTSKRRVLRLMRGHGLLAPTRVGRPHGPRAHDSTSRTERVDVMWGTDLTSVITDGGVAPIFVAVDHCSIECVGLHAARRATRFEALEPIRQGVRERFGAFAEGIAGGLNPDSPFRSHRRARTPQESWRKQGFPCSPVASPTIRPPDCSYPPNPGGRIRAEEFRRRYNETWLAARHGYRAPAQVRADQLGALVVRLEQMVPSPGPTKARIPGRRLPAGGYLLSASDH